VAWGDRGSLKREQSEICKRLPREKAHRNWRVKAHRQIDVRSNTEFIADGEADGNYLLPGNAIENTA
jgi:hypothetical protein